MVSIPKTWKPLPGKLYPIREELKELGARWDRDTGLWWISPERFSEAMQIIKEG